MTSSRYTDGYITAPEHRTVMEVYLGRRLFDDEVVHHINGDKRDNRIQNLMALTRSQHGHIHGVGVEMFLREHALCRLCRRYYLPDEFVVAEENGAVEYHCVECDNEMESDDEAEPSEPKELHYAGILSYKDTLRFGELKAATERGEISANAIFKRKDDICRGD